MKEFKCGSCEKKFKTDMYYKVLLVQCPKCKRITYEAIEEGEEKK